MSIQYIPGNDKIRCFFRLSGKNSEYVIAVVDEEGFIGHVYYGNKIMADDYSSLLRINESPYLPSCNDRDRGSFMDSFPVEYSTHGIGDYREDCLAIRTESGNTAVSLHYYDHEIIPGKPGIPNLPASFGTDKECCTLVIHAKDEPTGLQIDLLYTIFEECDVVTRSVRVTNTVSRPIYLTKVLSACLDMDNRDFEAITLHGSWARERYQERRPVGCANLVVESFRGEPGHQDHPFMALVSPNANDTCGQVYGMSFVYSGNFRVTCQNNQFNQVRMTMGISPMDFAWCLNDGETFYSPEVLMTYSDTGIGQMSRNYHDFMRKHLIRSPFLNKKRPILINNWEATYFDFTTEKLIAIASQAHELGIEMLVMDDGWFGNRFDDNRALGDWFVNEEKLPGGLPYLVGEINKLGMKFGIWFEPEMISPDSQLYRKHPDWAIAIKGRRPTRNRNQYVLDITRKEVRDYVFDRMHDILSSANIEYVKWDMNRPLTDIGSAVIPPERMGEFYHRYVLAVYELQERLLCAFPNLLLENCSGGGARFDPGMLYYSPQIWCSDDTDAVERLTIQEGTALVYPLSTMGAHVSDCPNHTVGRVTPFETRGHVALAGTFGYELDVTRIPEADRKMIPAQVAMYHKYNDLIREGDYYRIASYSRNHEFDCWGVVSKDKREALFTYVQVLGKPNAKSRRLYLQGLDPDMKYSLEGTECIYSGRMLNNGGLLQPMLSGDYQSKLLHLVAVVG